MKKSAIIRLVIYSLISLILVTVLVLGIIFGKSAVIGFSIGENNYDDSKYNINSDISEPMTFNEKDIQSLSVDWSQGEIIITRSQNQIVAISEQSNQNIDNEHCLRYRITDKGLLDIKFSKSRSFFSFLTDGIKKTLNISLPNKIYDKFNFDVKSADINITDADVSQITVDNVSGKTTLANVNCDRYIGNAVSGDLSTKTTNIKYLELDSVSGVIDYEGSIIQKANIDTSSGDILIRTSTLPTELTTDCLSAQVQLYIPENSGFTCEIDSVSGDFSTDFSTSTDNDKYYCGDAKANFKFESVSGDISVKKNNYIQQK